MSSHDNRRKIQTVFNHIFYRGVDSGWEESINPRLGHGIDFLLTCHLFILIQEKFKIDFWKWYHIKPHYSYFIHPDPNPYTYVRGIPHYNPSWQVGDRYERDAYFIMSDIKRYREDTAIHDGNPRFDTLFQVVEPHNPKDHDFNKDVSNWTMTTLFDPNSWTNSSWDWTVQYLNKIFKTNYTVDDYVNFDGEMDDELDEAWYEKLNGSETISYFQLMNYLIIWIDRWAHDIVDPSKIPEESKKHIMEYGGIKKYHCETDLDLRTTLLMRDDLNNPECLNPVWELFLMCEDEILNNDFFEVDEDYNIKMKEHKDEMYYPHGKFIKYNSATKIQTIWRGYNYRKNI